MSVVLKSQFESLNKYTPSFEDGKNANIAGNFAPASKQGFHDATHAGDTFFRNSDYPVKPVFAGESEWTSPRRIKEGDVDEDKKVKAGLVLKIMDAAGAIASRSHHNKHHIFTASMDSVQFIAPARLNDVLTPKVSIIRAGKYSLEVEVVIMGKRKTWGWPKTFPVAKGYLVYVAAGENRQPFPPLGKLPPKQAKRIEGLAQRHVHRQKEAQRMKDMLRPSSGGSSVLWSDNKPKHIMHQIHEELRVQFSEVAPDTMIRYKTSETHKNHIGKVFGGEILAQMYNAGKKAATLHAQESVQVRRLDQMQFIKPGEIGDVLLAKPVVTRVFDDRLIDVQVDIGTDRPRFNNRYLRCFLPKVHHTLATGHFLFEPGTSQRPLAQVALDSDVQQRRFDVAAIRYHSRQAEEESGSMETQKSPEATEKAS